MLMRPKRADLRLGRPQRRQSPVQYRGFEVLKLDRGTDFRSIRTDLWSGRAK